LKKSINTAHESMSSNVNEFNMNQLATASAFVDSDANFIAASFGVPTDLTATPTTTMNNPSLESRNGNDASSNNGTAHGSTGGKSTKKRRTSPSASAAKIQQLPMFLTKTYHMIEKVDPGIAGWSEAGDNFVVKNVDQFAKEVLPQYFKHSNFSSFARQLNFYGFRKLKAEPILTADFDEKTATYVRFFHEHFHRDKPDLLVHIKRATKSDPQSKDDVECLRSEILDLRSIVEQQASIIENMKMEYDRKIADLTFEMNAKHNRLVSRATMFSPSSNGIGASSIGLTPGSSQKSPAQSLSMLTQACSMIKSPALPPSDMPSEDIHGNTSFTTFSLK
jgi:hypothetical protein